MRLDHLLSKELTVCWSTVRSAGLVHSRVDHSLLGPLAWFLVGRHSCLAGGWWWWVGSLPLFRFEGTRHPSLVPLCGVDRGGCVVVLVVSSRLGCGRGGGGWLLENSIASTSIFVSEVFFQAMKSQRWMPWRLMPMKDVGGCEKPRGAADQASIRGCPNGETHHPSWGDTPA